jgi:hypothetical protein
MIRLPLLESLVSAQFFFKEKQQDEKNSVVIFYLM